MLVCRLAKFCFVPIHEQPLVASYIYTGITLDQEYQELALIGNCVNRIAKLIFPLTVGDRWDILEKIVGIIGMCIR